MYKENVFVSGKNGIESRCVCRGFEKKDINDKNQLIIEDGVQEINILEAFKNFEAEVDEIVFPETLEFIPATGFKNIRAKCFNVPSEVALHDRHSETFNFDALERIKITGGFVYTSFFNKYPRVSEIIIENGELLTFFDEKIPNHIRKLVISDNCKKARIMLSAFSSIDDIKFPKTFNPNIIIETSCHTSELSVNRFSKETLLQLLKYCPEIYSIIDAKICDKTFRDKAKDVIVSGMASRQQLKGYNDVSEDVEMLKTIKTKMNGDAQYHKTPEAKFIDAMADFYKE